MSKITIYKYQVANRAYGYEMFIKEMINICQETTQNSTERDIRSWIFLAKNECWEKSFLIYKTITPYLLKHFYRSTQLFDDILLRIIILVISLAIVIKFPEFIIVFILISIACIAWTLVDPRKYFLRENKSWISTKRDNKKLFSGSYLEHLLNMLTLMQFLALAPIAVAIIKINRPIIITEEYNWQELWSINNALGFIYQYKFLVLVIIFFLLFNLIIARYLIIKQQITMLESGFYSIKTNFLLWKIVSRINYESWLRSTNVLSHKSNVRGIDFTFENMFGESLNSCSDLIREYPNQPELWDFENHLNPKTESGSDRFSVHNPESKSG